MDTCNTLSGKRFAKAQQFIKNISIGIVLPIIFLFYNGALFFQPPVAISHHFLASMKYLLTMFPLSAHCFAFKPESHSLSQKHFTSMYQFLYQLSLAVEEINTKLCCLKQQDLLFLLSLWVNWAIVMILPGLVHVFKINLQADWCRMISFTYPIFSCLLARAAGMTGLWASHPQADDPGPVK